ncbi:hypothetical protein [Leucobacter sp. GX24907]
MDWTGIVWRGLCLLTGMLLIAVMGGLVPESWLPVVAAVVMGVALVVVVGGLHDSERSGRP